MNDVDRARYRAILENLAAELCQRMRCSEEDKRSAHTRYPDPADLVTATSEQNMVTSVADKDWRKLQAVKRALERIKGHSFGECIKCEEEISHKRLDIVPWTERCASCQAEADGTKVYTPHKKGVVPNLMISI